MGVRLGLRSGSRRTPAQAADTVGLVIALTVLLEAGATPAAAWRLLADSSPEDSVARRVAEANGPIGEAVAGASDDWAITALAATWRVAETVGASMAAAMRAIIETLGDAEEALGDARVALAEPAAAVRLMAALPLVGVAMGAAMGFGTLGVLLTHPIGIACGVFGLALMVAAARWTKRLSEQARPPEVVAGLRAELLAIALSSGASIARARSIVDDALSADERLNAEADAATEDALELAQSAGVPASELLRARAKSDRRQYRATARSQAAALGAKLLLPLGVCTLPAFMLLGVAPMLLSVLGATL